MNQGIYLTIKYTDMAKVSDEMELKIRRWIDDVLIRLLKGSMSFREAKNLLGPLMGQTINPFLRFYTKDREAKIFCVSNFGSFEDHFGSLVEHQKREGVDGIPALTQLVIDKHLVFDSKEKCIAYVEAQVASGTLKKEYPFLFLFFNKKGKVSVLYLFFESGRLIERVSDLSGDRRWYVVSKTLVVVPNTVLSKPKK